jgi:ubiquinone/menaquinone biosynthesis C-methylase UbiE
MVVVTSNQRDVIFEAVRAMYTDVATKPWAEFHFPTGRHACEVVGYPVELLDRLPAAAVESFAGVGYPFKCDVIRAGDVVLDIGSGSGTDIFVALERAGSTGHALALDMTAAMREKLRRLANENGVAERLDILDGYAEDIPLPDATVDVVTSNGVINLVPDKSAVAREIYRVLKPGGRVQIADIVLEVHAGEACRSNAKLWAECIVGATPETEYVMAFERAGFEAVEVLQQFDYFAASSSQSTRDTAHGLGAHSIVMRARKPL